MFFNYNKYFCTVCGSWADPTHICWGTSGAGGMANVKITTSGNIPHHESFNDEIHALAGRIADMVIRKQLDYGTDNILQAPGGAESGIVVRLWDKISRLKNLVYSKREANNEAIDDTYADIAGYALVALMVREGKFTLPITDVEK